LGGDHFSAAEKNEGRIIDIIGLEEREHCALLAHENAQSTDSFLARVQLRVFDGLYTVTKKLYGS
jgi:hypothetical protein